MAYAEFDLKKAVETFGLIEDDKIDLFERCRADRAERFLRVSSMSSRQWHWESIRSRLDENTSFHRS